MPVESERAVELSLPEKERFLQEQLERLQLELDEADMATTRRLRVRAEVGAFDWRGFVVSEGWCHHQITTKSFKKALIWCDTTK